MHSQAHLENVGKNGDFGLLFDLIRHPDRYLNLNLLGHLCYDRHKFFSNALDLNQFFDLMGGSI